MKNLDIQACTNPLGANTKGEYVWGSINLMKDFSPKNSACNWPKSEKLPSKLPSRHNRSPHPSQKTEKNFSLVVYHQNIQGLAKKTEELSICANNYLNSKNPVNIICLTEHHLRSEYIQRVIVPSFNLGAYYCRTNISKGGGVCIYLRDTISHTALDVSQFCKDQHVECCGVKISLHKKDIILLSIYRAPSGNFNVFLSQLDAILSSTFSVNYDFILCGDFNVDYLVDSTQKNQLNFLLNSFNLSYVVNFPTRITSSTATAIDNIFINKSKHEQYTVVPIVNGLSDHDAQILNINLNFCYKTKLTTKTKIRRINKFTLGQLKSSLKTENWNILTLENDPNQQYNHFIQTILLHLETNCPVKISNIPKKSDKQNAWITRGIINSCNTKRLLYLKAKNSSHPETIAHYKIYCKILQKVIVKAKSIHFENRIYKSSNKIKTMWDIVKDETSTDVSCDTFPILKINNIIINDKSMVANEFNEYFINVASNLVCTINTLHDPISFVKTAFPYKFANIKINPVSPREIKAIINVMKPKSSSGYDEINSKIIKHCADELIWPLTLICNNCLNSGVFPDRLKYAVVIPVHKKGDKTRMDNYRPISLLSTFSKILEKVIYKNLLNHLIDNKILTPSQFGFQKKMSTDNATFKLTTEILEALNNHESVISIFYDLAKAFDCVNHQILLEKLEYYGIRGKFHNLIESYLNSRTQTVRIKDQISGINISSISGQIRHGVPQGSILGPLLFLIYINDLPSCIESQAVTVLFADDTSILVRNKSKHKLTDYASQVLVTLDEWFNANKLVVNVDKTNFIDFVLQNKVKNDIQLWCKDKEIKQTKNTKFLGVQISENLNWKTHIQKLMATLSSACYALRCMRNKINTAALKTVYFAYFHSAMKYGILLWGNSTNAKKIFVMQKKALRIVCQKKSRDSCRPLFKNLRVLTLSSQYIYSVLVFLSDNFQIFQLNSSVHPYSTRTQNNIHCPANNLSLYQSGTYYSAIKLFNKLPHEVKDLCTSNKPQFKRILKNYLLKNAFYTVDEFLHCPEPFSLS